MVQAVKRATCSRLVSAMFVCSIRFSNLATSEAAYTVGNQSAGANTSQQSQPTTATAGLYDPWYHPGPPHVYCPHDIVQAVDQGNVTQLVTNIAQGIDNKTDGLLVAQGTAFAQASSGTVDGQTALAVAYAAALCEQGETAQAFSQAFVVAVFCDEKSGCLVLSTARSIAQANCSNIGGQVTSYSNATTYATAALLGHCKVAVPSCRNRLRNFHMPGIWRPSKTRALLRKFLPPGITPPTRDNCRNRNVCLPSGILNP